MLLPLLRCPCSCSTPPRVPLVALFLPVAVFSCFGSDPKPSGEDGSADSSTGVASAGTAPAGSCAAMPDARRFHQMSWFITDPAIGPILLTSADGNPVWVERGLLVYGGIDASTDGLLSDLWLFDLTNGSVWDSTVAGASALYDGSDPADLDGGVYDYCRWHQLDSSGNPPLARGSMVYVPDLERFVVVGGWTEDGDTSWTTHEVTALDLRDIETGVATLSDLGSGLPSAGATWHLDAAQDDAGDPLCEGTYTSEIFNYFDAHICTLTSNKCTGCITHVETISGSGADCDEAFDVGACSPDGGAFAACADDLYCTDGVAFKQRTAATQGLSGHVALYDPVADQVRVFGGASGCTGSECGAFELALKEGQAGETSERATLLNDVDLLVDPSTGAVTTLGVDRDRFTPLSEEWPTDDLDAWPSEASPGVHQLAVALTGLTWDRSLRTWSGSTVDAFGKGGTRYAALAPYQRLEFSSGVADTGDPGACEWTSSCYQVPGEWLVVDAADSEADGIISAAYGTAGIDLSASTNDYGAHGLSSVSDAVRAAAMVATDADRMLLIGGRNSSGITGDVVDIQLGGDSEYVHDVGSRYGASAAWDPVMRTAYVFGGSTGTSVRTISYDDDPMARNTGSSFEMGAVEVDVQAPSGDPTGAWTLSAAFEVTHTCQDSTGGAQCFTSWLPVYVPLDPGSSDLGTLEIELTFGDGTVTTPTVAEFDKLADHRAVRYDLRLPRGLEDGESVVVSVRYQAVPVDVERYQDAVGQERPVLQLFSHSGVSWDFLVGSLPAWVEGGVDTLPLLGLTDFSHDDPTTGAGTSTVQQLQRQMFPEWSGGDAMDSVPYLLACSPVGATETQAFDVCISFTGDGAADPTPATTASDPVVLSLNELGPLGDPMPVTYTILTGAHLHATRLGIQPYRVDSLRRCRFGATDPEDCTIVEDTGEPTGCAESTYDFDGDCFPAQDDCDDHNADTHPLQVAGAEAPCSLASGSVDHNCDGWTCE